MASTEQLGQRVRALRRQRGLSQEQLAAPGLSASYISLIESGRRQPAEAALSALAAALGTSVQHLQHGHSATTAGQAELDLRLAEVALASGSYDEAERRFRSQLGAADAVLRPRAQQGLAQALEAQGHLEQAIAVYESLRDSSAGGADGWVSATVALIRCYREAGDLGRSADLGERALEHLTSLGLTATDLHVQLGASVAFTAYERGDLVRARYLIDRVMRQADELGSARAQGSALWNAAIITAERGEVATALELSEQALLLFHEEGRSRQAARLRNSFAELLLRTDPPRPEQALELLRSAHADLAEVGTVTDLAYCETEIARAHLLLGDAPAAVAAARDALHHLPAAEERLERSRALVVLADAWLAAGDVDAAEAAYREAGETLVAAGAGRQAARVWRQLSDHLERRGDVVGALAALKAATDAIGVPGAAQPLQVER
ncbi:MAG: transcriptional regulator [Frankiales bacterium]|nr:transcriptional regulator [Frankiales bacterium]